MADTGGKQGEKDHKKGKKGIKAIALIILIPVMIIVFLAAAFFATVQGILDIIKAIIMAIIDFLRSLIQHPIATMTRLEGIIDNVAARELGLGDEFDEDAYLDAKIDPCVVITLDKFEDIKSSLDEVISRNTIGLDDFMLKKMYMTMSIGLYLSDTNILIELREEDFENDEWDDIVDTVGEDPGEEPLDCPAAEPFKVMRGNSEEGFGEDNKIYLVSKGIINITYYGEPLVYYSEETLSKIKEKEYDRAVENEHYEYAENVLKFLDKCYTYNLDGDGIKKWAYNPTTKEERWKLLYVGGSKEFLVKPVVKVLDPHEVNIQYYDLVAEYAVPMEYMIHMLDFTDSPNFLDCFMETVMEKCSINMELVEVYTQITTEEEENFTREMTINFRERYHYWDLTRYDGSWENLESDFVYDWDLSSIKIIAYDHDLR